MDGITKQVKAYERATRRRLVDQFTELAKKYAADVVAKQQVPNNMQYVRVWRYIPMFPPIPFFFTREIAIEVRDGDYGFSISRSGRLLMWPNQYLPTWKHDSLRWMSNDQIIKMIDALKAEPGLEKKPSKKRLFGQRPKKRLSRQR